MLFPLTLSTHYTHKQCKDKLPSHAPLSLFVSSAVMCASPSDPLLSMAAPPPATAAAAAAAVKKFGRRGRFVN